MISRRIARPLPLLLVLLVLGCAGSREARKPILRYIGSSTVANYLRDAEPVYDRVQFLLDTEPESAGGELAILEGRGDLVGVAGPPRPETLRAGVVASLVGRDAIAVVVHGTNPVEELSLAQLRGVFRGEIASWSELGGPDVAVRPFIVCADSATRNVFRSAVLGEADYAGCTVVRPDSAILDRVREEPGAIGQISLSFHAEGVKRLAIEGQAPSLANARYPITRPLYLLWWPGRGRVAEFVEWSHSPEGRAVLQRRFAPPDEGRDTNEGGSR